MPLPKITESGWYLLSSEINETINQLVSRYGKKSYLDISKVYVPLFYDISNQIGDNSDICFNNNNS